MNEQRENWDLKQLGSWGFIRKLYAHHKPSGGALILRIALASIYLMEGWTKVQNFTSTAHFFSTIGLASPVWLYLVIMAEIGGGLCILFGILTKPACVALAIEMAVIIMGLPQPHGGIFNGHTYEMFLLVSLISLYIGGPGKYSLAHLWLKRRSKQ